MVRWANDSLVYACYREVTSSQAWSRSAFKRMRALVLLAAQLRVRAAAN